MDLQSENVAAITNKVEKHPLGRYLLTDAVFCLHARTCVTETNAATQFHIIYVFKTWIIDNENELIRQRALINKPKLENQEPYN